MTVPLVSTYDTYTATALQDTFTYNFKILEEDYILVTIDGTLKTKTVDYTITGVGNEGGGTIVLTTPLTGGESVVLERSTAISRTTDFATAGAYKAVDVNYALDKTISIVQESDELINRAPRFERGEELTDLTLPTPTANTVLSYNSDATAIEASTTISEISNAQTYANNASGFADTAETHKNNAALEKGYAEEWANKAEDSLVSVAAGGDNVDDYSALHFSAKASEYASNASASATAAAAAASSNWASQVLNVASADSPIVPTATENGALYIVTMDGNVEFDLSSIATLGEGYRFGILRNGASNSLTITPDGTDTVNGLGTWTIDSNSETALIVADDNSPDNWVYITLSQTSAGTGLTKTGSTMSLDVEYIPSDIAFKCGYDGAGLETDVAVQEYGHVILTRDMTFDGVEAYADTAPAGANLQFDIKKNGVSIFSTVPEIDAGSNADDGNHVIGTATASAGDRLTFEVLQVGSSTAGSGVQFSIKGHLSSAAAPSGDAPVYIPQGTVSAPALYFTGDSDTGIYSGGSGEVCISANGTQVFCINDTNIFTHQTGWNDLTAPLNAAKLGGVNDPNFKVFQGGLYAYAFDPNTAEEVFLVFHFDHDIKPGSDFFPHVHWAPEDTNTGTVRWGIEYSIARGHSQDAFSTPTTVYIEQAATGTAYQHQVAEHATGVSMANLEPDTLVIARMFRDASHANDTYTGDAFAFMVDMHYQTDREVTVNRSPNFYGA
ncbi:hypothetical protein V5T82_14230 [Magnetovibrio sp. PR-2]|uniref:hypothetical protein n=1 Tax=Magnetovibrio sp. PR-2 TaxID=3120356 RepID=UPI002FCE55D0